MLYNILEAQPPTLKGSALNSPTFGDANDVNYKKIIFLPIVQNEFFLLL